MDPIFAINEETGSPLNQEQYTKGIELLTEMIHFYLSQDSIPDDQQKDTLVLCLKKRINANCTIEQYQYVLDDIESLKKFNVDVDMDIELFLANAEATLAKKVKEIITDLERAQDEHGWNFELIIRRLKSINIKRLFKRNPNRRSTQKRRYDA